MTGTYIIATVGYGFALLLAYEFVVFGWRSIFVDGLGRGRDSALAPWAAIGAILVAAVTRWLTGGAL